LEQGETCVGHGRDRFASQLAAADAGLEDTREDHQPEDEHDR